jgi:hypothetical protein
MTFFFVVGDTNSEKETENREETLGNFRKIEIRITKKWN